MTKEWTFLHGIADTEGGEGSIKIAAAFSDLPAITRADILKDIKTEIDGEYAKARADLRAENRKGRSN